MVALKSLWFQVVMLQVENVSSQRLAMIQNLDVILFITHQHLSHRSCIMCSKLSSVCRMFYVEQLLFGVRLYYYKLKFSANVISLCNPWLYLRMRLVHFTSHPWYVVTCTWPVQKPYVISDVTYHKTWINWGNIKAFLVTTKYTECSKIQLTIL
jgi:hypothetical protein